MLLKNNLYKLINDRLEENRVLEDTSYETIKSVLHKNEINNINYKNNSEQYNINHNNDEKWSRVDDVITVFSDLKNSTQLSQRISKEKMSDVLGKVNYPFVIIHKFFGAEFIDMKGDGGIALYSKGKEFNALMASFMFNDYITSNENYYQKHYNLKIYTGIAQSNLLVKKISNYVWAGESINKAADVCKLIKKRSDTKEFSAVGMDEEFFNKNIQNENIQKLHYLFKLNHNGKIWRDASPKNKDETYKYSYYFKLRDNINMFKNSSNINNGVVQLFYNLLMNIMESNTSSIDSNIILNIGSYENIYLPEYFNNNIDISKMYYNLKKNI